MRVGASGADASSQTPRHAIIGHVLQTHRGGVDVVGPKAQVIDEVGLPEPMRADETCRGFSSVGAQVNRNPIA